MPKQELKEQLKALHDTLNSSPELDDESQELLGKIAADISAIEGSSDFSELTDAVQEQVIRFEQEHPAISAILRQITDTLGRIGV